MTAQIMQMVFIELLQALPEREAGVGLPRCPIHVSAQRSWRSTAHRGMIGGWRILPRSAICRAPNSRPGSALPWAARPLIICCTGGWRWPSGRSHGRSLGSGDCGGTRLRLRERLWRRLPSRDRYQPPSRDTGYRVNFFALCRSHPRDCVCRAGRIKRVTKIIPVGADLTFLEIVEGKSRTFVCTNIRANDPRRPKGYCNSGLALWLASRGG